MALTKISRSLLNTGVSDSSDATAITIDSSENVGIGVTSLSQKLEVNGNVGITDNLGVGTGSSSPNSRLQIKKDGTGNYANQTFTNAFGIAGSGTGNYLANNAFLLNTGSSAFIFGTGDTERMRIASDGKVGIGTTSPNGVLDVQTTSSTAIKILQDSTSAAFTIQQNGSNAFNHIGEFFCPNLTNTENALLAIGKSGNTKQSGYLGYYWTADNSDNNFFHMSHWAADYLFRVYGNGNYSFAGSNVSDRDLKENIIDITESSLDKVKQLRVRKFNMIPLGKNDVTPTKVGFIAQEVQPYLPDVVSGTDGEKDMGVDITGIVGHLVRAIKEQQDIIDDLKSRIETLEG